VRRLLIRPGGIGDVILSLPALEYLRADYTEVWVPRPMVPLIRWADCVRPIASTGLDLLGLPDVEPPAHLLESLSRFDSVVTWYGAGRAEFRDAVAALGLPFRFLDALPSEHRHAADIFLDQAGGQGHAVPAIPRHAVPHDTLVIHPFSGSQLKNWPLNRFRAVAQSIDVTVAWNAGPEETLDDAVRFDDLYELACWLGGSHLYLGNDSGITHLAAAAGARVVALFGASDPDVWAPRGDCVRVIRGSTMDAIGVPDVLNAVRELW
jgi:ADP-heptose:LPS heptosyltransferase